MIPVVDISQYNGPWIDRGEDADMIKIGGGDAGIYFDPDAATNYTDAKDHQKGVGGYWFIGWTIGSAQEASAFLRGMSPLAENDVYALDIERGAVAVPADAVAYVTAMVTYIHDKIGVWPMLYMSLSTLNSYNWDSLLANCGLWLADWAVSPQANIPTTHSYIMQQYSDGPNYDHDEFFGTLAQFNAYGYHAPQSSPTVATVTPVESSTTQPVTATPVATSSSTTSTTPSTTEDNTQTKTTDIKTPIEQDKASTLDTSIVTTTTKNSGSWWARLLNWMLVFVGLRHG